MRLPFLTYEPPGIYLPGGSLYPSLALVAVAPQVRIRQTDYLSSSGQYRIPPIPIYTYMYISRDFNLVYEKFRQNPFAVG